MRAHFSYEISSRDIYKCPGGKNFLQGVDWMFDQQPPWDKSDTMITFGAKKHDVLNFLQAHPKHRNHFQDQDREKIESVTIERLPDGSYKFTLSYD